MNAKISLALTSINEQWVLTCFKIKKISEKTVKNKDEPNSTNK